MTLEEKLEMYANKKAFIDSLSKSFAQNLSKSSVTSLEYEVYRKEVNADTTYFAEYVVVNFIGGGKCVRFVNGNSNIANFRVIGEMLDGGYYSEIPDYNSLSERGFRYVILKPSTNRLDDLLSKPMNHISDVRACLNHCKNGRDVIRVIDSIPAKFGVFTVEFNEDGETFLITNSYEEGGDPQIIEVEYEFWVEED